jgi:acyl carrier protein
MSATKEFTKSERERVIRLISALAIPPRMPHDVAAEARLIDDLGFDSMRLIELTMALERAFGLPVQRPENLATINTVDDLVTFALTATAELL